RLSDLWERATAAEGAFPCARLFAARVHFRARRFSRVVANVKTALSPPGGAGSAAVASLVRRKLLLCLADACLHIGESHFGAARSSYESVLAESPDNIGALLGLAVLAARRGAIS